MDYNSTCIVLLSLRAIHYIIMCMFYYVCMVYTALYIAYCTSYCFYIFFTSSVLYNCVFFFLLRGWHPLWNRKKKRRKSKKKKEKYTALSAVNTKFTSTILFSTLACIGGPFLHSSLVFNGCAVDFLTCTQHSENHADPLVQSLTISNSKTKLEAAVWSNTRTFYGYSTFSHAIVNTQTPMVWSGKIISQRTKLTQTSLIARPIHM